MASREDALVTVLVVEDDRSLVRMLRIVLKRAGFAVSEVTTGAEALRCLAQEGPDAVVLDLGLPDGLGRAVLERLQRPGARGDKAPVWMVVSALDSREATLRYGPLGPHFLAKPFDPWHMVRVLQELLTAKRQSGDEDASS